MFVDEGVRGWRWTRDRLLAVHLDDGVPDSAPGAFGEGRSVVVPAGPPGCASSRGGQRAGVPARRDHGDPAAAGRDRAGGRAVPAWTPTLNSIRPPVGQPVDATRRLRAARGHRGATFDRLVLHQAAPGHRSRVASPSRPIVHADPAGGGADRTDRDGENNRGDAPHVIVDGAGPINRSCHDAESVCRRGKPARTRRVADCRPGDPAADDTVG